MRRVPRPDGPNDFAVHREDGVYLSGNDFDVRDGGQCPDKEMANGMWLLP